MSVLANAAVSAYWENMSETHIFTNNGTQALDPKNPRAAELANEQSLAGKHGLAETLRLVTLGNARGARQKSVLAGTPSILAREADVGDIAKRSRRQQQLAWSRVRRHGHFTAGDELFHAEFDGAFESHGGRHGDHGARFGFERAADGQLDGHDGVAVAVADAVAAAVEGSHIVDGGAGAGEVVLGRGTAGHG